jgi:DNA-binding transcriptional ArsR family regulator
MDVELKGKKPTKHQRKSAADVCELFCYDAGLVAQLKGELTNLAGAVALFRVLADPTRCTMLAALNRTEELCVCDLAHITGLSLPTVSHHLRRLRDLGLVRFRREGKMVFYRLVDERVRQLLAQAAQHEAARA